MKGLDIRTDGSVFLVGPFIRRHHVEKFTKEALIPNSEMAAARLWKTFMKVLSHRAWCIKCGASYQTCIKSGNTGHSYEIEETALIWVDSHVFRSQRLEIRRRIVTFQDYLRKLQAARA